MFCLFSISLKEAGDISESQPSSSKDTREKKSGGLLDVTLKYLDDLQTRGELCDALIKLSDGTNIPVHRNIMAASSGYFKVTKKNFFSTQ